MEDFENLDQETIEKDGIESPEKDVLNNEIIALISSFTKKEKRAKRKSRQRNKKQCFKETTNFKRI